MEVVLIELLLHEAVSQNVYTHMEVSTYNTVDLRESRSNCDSTALEALGDTIVWR
jgi:hypothetical protein